MGEHGLVPPELCQAIERVSTLEAQRALRVDLSEVFEGGIWFQSSEDKKCC